MTTPVSPDAARHLGDARVSGAYGDQAEQAFALLRDEPKPIDLLLVDVIMPALSGRDFAASVQARWPEGQVIFMSGYSVERLPAPGVPVGARLVSKPIVMQVLLDTVGTALGLPADRV